MNKPELLGLEVLTPDGRGSILALHTNSVLVHLNRKKVGQVMKGQKRGELHYSYAYEDVEIIKGQYCFNDERINFQYDVDNKKDAQKYAYVIAEGSDARLRSAIDKLHADNPSVVVVTLEEAKDLFPKPTNTTPLEILPQIGPPRVGFSFEGRSPRNKRREAERKAKKGKKSP